jgi:hypothetical protein
LKNSGKKIALFDDKGKNRSCLLIKAIEKLSITSFAKHLSDGIQVSLIGAIDFTYSNGATSNP